MKRRLATRSARLTRLGFATASVVVAVPLVASAQTLAQAMGARGKGNIEGQAAQARIDKISDETDTLLSQYRSANKQIDSLRVYNQQMSDLIAAQEAEIASLREQIDNVELVSRGVTPLMLRMIDAIDQFVELDVPFLIEERQKRVANLRELMDRSDVTNAEKYRRIMEAYQIENDFGRTIEAYRGVLTENGSERTVDFLRVGRVALVYQTLDGSEAAAWDQASRSWKPLDASYRNPIKQGLRIARKQSAPDLIRLPLPAANSGGQS